MVNFIPTIRLAQSILKRNFPFVDKPLKRAFEKCKPRGLFSEFYGILRTESFSFTCCVIESDCTGSIFASDCAFVLLVAITLFRICFCFVLFVYLFVCLFLIVEKEFFIRYLLIRY